MVMKKRVLTSPVDAVVFDCDGTLSTIEGITELAKQNGVFQQVCELTEKAMVSTGIDEALYRQRLDLVNPCIDQVVRLADHYYRHLTVDVDRVITVLQKLGKAVFVASAGIAQAVERFAQQLTIPVSHVHSVNVGFDEHGRYTNFDTQSPLVRQYGKADIVNDLKKDYRCVVHIGDGMNDAEAAAAADLFVGYGGAFFRQSIADLSDVYLTDQSMLAVLPHLLSDEEMALLPEGSY